ncbi:MAG: fasciclin domain-containing protein [Pedobacter sp.]|nr:MAG: fasciclin domain-containing protein [Pedobacter sp.]
MKKKLSYLLLSALACGILVAATPKSADTRQSTQTSTKLSTPVNPVQSKDVVDIAIGSPDHTTLVAAVKAAGLVETLKGSGPFTVFAPTNAAFAALPAGTVDGLLKPAKKADLTSILTYHVVSGAVKAADLKNGQKIKTVQGAELTVSIKDGKVKINGANVTAADLEGSNGVVHVIDAVLMPKK